MSIASGPVADTWYRAAIPSGGMACSKERISCRPSGRLSSMVPLANRASWRPTPGRRITKFSVPDANPSILTANVPSSTTTPCAKRLAGPNVITAAMTYAVLVFISTATRGVPEGFAPNQEIVVWRRVCPPFVVRSIFSLSNVSRGSLDALISYKSYPNTNRMPERSKSDRVTAPRSSGSLRLKGEHMSLEGVNRSREARVTVFSELLIPSCKSINPT